LACLLPLWVGTVGRRLARVGGAYKGLCVVIGCVVSDSRVSGLPRAYYPVLSKIS
jgi:hypothetical protein